LLIIGFTYSLPLALSAFHIRSALMNMGNPISQALAMDLLPPHQRASFASLQNALGNLGRGGLGPVISGFLQTLGGFQLAFAFTAFTYGLAATMYYRFFRHTEPTWYTKPWAVTMRMRLDRIITDWNAEHPQNVAQISSLTRLRLGYSILRHAEGRGRSIGNVTVRARYRRTHRRRPRHRYTVRQPM
jgi:MFS family permease